jgi:AcrR family transcriptional regulator
MSSPHNTLEPNGSTTMKSPSVPTLSDLPGAEPATEPDRASGSAETRERLLDTAEKLFAERGFEGTSMRAITQGAGTSVSAANYHFGSKEKLLQEALRRATEPINARRIQLLDEAIAAAGGAPLEIETILDAYLRPVIEYRKSGKAEQGRQISARLFSDPPELIHSIKVEIFGPMTMRFSQALAQSMPDREAIDIELGNQFLIAIMVYVISGQLETSSLAAMHPDGVEDDRLLTRMIEFVAGGLRALPPA